MHNLHDQVYESECFAISVLSDFLGISREAIEHLSAQNENAPVDLRLHSLTFDVKFSRPTLDSKKKTQLVWDFDIRYKQSYCDYLILIGMENNHPSAVFAVPGEISPLRHLRISINGISKWHTYRIWGKTFPDNGLTIEKANKTIATSQDRAAVWQKNRALRSPLSAYSDRKCGQGIEHFMSNPL